MNYEVIVVKICCKCEEKYIENSKAGLCRKYAHNYWNNI